MGWWGEGVTRGVVQRVLGGVGGMSGECEAGGRGLVLCVEAYGLVVRLRVWQRRFLFLGGVIVGVCIGAVDGGRGGAAWSLWDVGWDVCLVEAFTFPLLESAAF